MADKQNNDRGSNGVDFAIIETGGKQYKVRKGDTLKIERTPGLKEGDAVSFDRVLLREDGKETKVGLPFLSGASVKGKVMVLGRAPKVEVMKYKAKSRYKKVRGHRQPYMTVTIESL